MRVSPGSTVTESRVLLKRDRGLLRIPTTGGGGVNARSAAVCGRRSTANCATNPRALAEAERDADRSRPISATATTTTATAVAAPSKGTSPPTSGLAADPWMTRRPRNDSRLSPPALPLRGARSRADRSNRRAQMPTVEGRERIRIPRALAARSSASSIYPVHCSSTKAVTRPRPREISRVS
jgi:hypothetical protein